jgi:hypothetical protein
MAVAAFFCGAAARVTGDPFVQEAKGVVVDWRQGTLTARGVAAADWRTPSAEVARLGAERRARSEGRSRLGEALRALPLGGGRHLAPAEIARAVERARADRVDYQSNGGVALRLQVAFGDWDEAAPAAHTSPDASPPSAEAEPLPLLLAEGALCAAPVLVIGQQEIPLGRVSYAPTGELGAGVHPLAIHADKKGRLVADDGLKAEALTRRRVVIYVQKLTR